MPSAAPRELLIQCQACSVENIFSAYKANQLIYCNQCRDQLVVPNLAEVCSQFDCKDCGFSVLVLKKTPFHVGEAVCRCGNKNLFRVEPITLYADAVRAGAFDEDDEANQSGDWYRSEPIDEGGEDYNKLFDNDLGVG